MSNYLNFFLVPKRKEGQEKQKPMHLMSYSRSSDIYQTFYEELNPPFDGGGNHFMELTKADIDRVITENKEHLRRTENRLNSRIQAYRTLHKEESEDAVEDYVSTSEYIGELKDTISTLKNISQIVYGLEFSDFEKIMINID